MRVKCIFFAFLYMHSGLTDLTFLKEERIQVLCNGMPDRKMVVETPQDPKSEHYSPT